MLPETALPFKYESSTTSGATALAGIPLYLELARIVDLRRLVAEHLAQRGGEQGWRDPDMLTSLVLLNLAGGDCVSDLELLKQDEGFVRLYHGLACVGLKRRERRAKLRLLEKTSDVPLPSASAVFRFLASFHGAEQDVERQPGKAVIVPEHPRLRGLWQVAAGMLQFMQRHKPLQTVTLDADATLVETHKAQALHCYKGYKAYQPLNFFVAEWDMIAYSQFRDGNVPCGYQQLDALQRALQLLPQGVQKVKLRMDTQGYEWDLLRYLAEGKNERFGVIDFAIGADVTAEFKREVVRLPARAWTDLPRQPGQVAQQWAEVPFVPNASATRRNGPAYRFVATRELLSEQPLPGVEMELPFPTMDFNDLGKCKVHAVVTNTTLGGADLVAWYRERCGKSEEAHSIMKSDLAGGQLPSGQFGSNAAWWTMTLISLNLNQMLKRLAMPPAWAHKRLKAMRAHVICVAARVVEHARQTIVRLSEGHRSTTLIHEIRARLLALEEAPSG